MDLNEIGKKLNDFGDKLNDTLNGVNSQNGGFNSGLQSFNDNVNAGLSKLGASIGKVFGVPENKVEYPTVNESQKFNYSGLDGLGNSGAFVAEDFIKPALDFAPMNDKNVLEDVAVNQEVVESNVENISVENSEIENVVLNNEVASNHSESAVVSLEKEETVENSSLNAVNLTKAGD